MARGRVGDVAALDIPIPAYVLRGDSFLIPGRGLCLIAVLTARTPRADLERLRGSRVVWEGRLYEVTATESYCIESLGEGVAFSLLVRPL